MVSLITIRFVESERETIFHYPYQSIYNGIWHFTERPIECPERIMGTWAGERELLLSIKKTPEEYLKTLKENLELAKVYAEYYSDIE